MRGSEGEKGEWKGRQGGGEEEEGEGLRKKRGEGGNGVLGREEVIQ